eukprot:scaffold1554_cov401-Prasinococcus_capsulatus_cf.AAC.27
MGRDTNRQARTGGGDVAGLGALPVALVACRYAAARRGRADAADASERATHGSTGGRPRAAACERRHACAGRSRSGSPHDPN